MTMPAIGFISVMSTISYNALLEIDSRAPYSGTGTGVSLVFVPGAKFNLKAGEFLLSAAQESGELAGFSIKRWFAMAFP